MVNIGGKPFPIMFDLGGGHEMVLGDGLLKRHLKHYTYTGETITTYDAEGRSDVQREVKLKTMQLGNLVFNNVTAFEMKDEVSKNWGGGVPDDSEVILNGHIDTHFFMRHHLNILIDYKAQKLYIIRGEGHPPGYSTNEHMHSWHKTKFFPPNITTHAQLNSTEVKLLWDTGAQFHYIKKGLIQGKKSPCSQLVASELGLPRTKCYGIETDLMIPEASGKLSHIGPAVFYPYDLSSILEIDGILSAPFFKEHVVYINFSEKTVSWY